MRDRPWLPDDAKWWLADVIVEFQVEGEAGNLVHYILLLVRADSAEEAYEKALELGRQEEMEYWNPEGKKVTSQSRGLRDLTVVLDELEHGAELLYEEREDAGEEELRREAKPKERMSVFGE